MVERLLLEPEQTLSWRHRMGKTPSLRSWQVAAIERARNRLRERFASATPDRCLRKNSVHCSWQRTLLSNTPNQSVGSDCCWCRTTRSFPTKRTCKLSKRQQRGILPPARRRCSSVSATAAFDSPTRTSGGAIAVNSGEIPNNGIDDDGNGYVDDYRGYNITWRNDGTAPDNVFHPTDGHGTSVAGIIAAVQNNGKGISGVAPGCRIVPIKATPNSTDGYILFGYESLIYARFVVARLSTAVGAMKTKHQVPSRRALSRSLLPMTWQSSQRPAMEQARSRCIQLRTRECSA